jgi:hypothetical protein
MKYAIRISSRTIKTSVHSPSCQVVTKKQPLGYYVVAVEALSALRAAEEFAKDEQLEERGVKVTEACGCCQ